MYNWYLEVLRDRVWSRFELDLRGAGWSETGLQTRLAISSFSQVSLSAAFLFQHANFSGDRFLFSNKWTKNAMTISEFIEYSPSYLLVLIPSWNTAQRRTQHKDFNKFRQQRQMIQITKKRCSIAFQPKWRENEISRSFDQLAVLFQRKFSKTKLNLNRLTNLSKPTNKMKTKWYNENKE